MRAGGETRGWRRGWEEGEEGREEGEEGAGGERGEKNWREMKGGQFCVVSVVVSGIGRIGRAERELVSRKERVGREERDLSVVASGIQREYSGC